MNQLMKPAEDLLLRITAAVAEANKARDEQVSKSKAVGLLLLEAKKMHPKTKDFEAYLKRVDGLSLSWAYDLLKLAGGRVTEDQLRKDAAERQQKARDKKKLPPKPILKMPDSAVTELPKTKAVLKFPEPKPEPFRDVTEKGETKTASARALAEFTFACRTWLPKITVKADRHKANMLFMELYAMNDEASDDRPKRNH